MGDEPILMGTDNEQGATVRILGARDAEPGAAILPTEVGSILERSKDVELVIEAGDGKLSIRGESSEFDMSMEDPDLFPELPGFEDGGYRVCAAADLRFMIDRTTYACMPDGEYHRTYTLSGCVAEFDGGRMMMGATDGCQIARVFRPAGSEGDISGFNERPVVPEKFLNRLGKHLSDDDPPVRFRAGDKDILVRTATATLYSRLLEGRFPPLTYAIPEPFVASARVKAGDLDAAAQQAAILTAAESEAVDFRFAPGVLSLHSRAGDKGKSRVQVPLDYDGKEVVEAIRPKYLIKALKPLAADDEVAICLQGYDTGIAFRSDDDYTFVIGLVSRRDP